MMFQKLMFILPLIIAAAGLLLDGNSSVAATSSSSYRNKLRRGDGDRQLASDESSYDSASHDNSHDVAFSAASDTAMEASDDGSTSHDMAVSAGGSDESAYDSASHDNSHDVAFSAADAAAMESSSPDGSSSHDDLAASSSVSDESTFDSASHDNSHDVAVSSADESSSASSGDCASITDTVCAMEGVTVFCELLQNPKRRHLGLMGTISTSTDEDTDADTEVVAMSSPTGASTSGSSDGADNADFASAFGFEDESEEFTLFVPTDAAFAEIAEKFETLSDAEAGRVIMFHMYSGMLLTSDKLACSETITSMNKMSDTSRTKCKNDGKKYQNGNGNTKTGSMPEIDTADHMACNGVIHTLNHVMFPVSLLQLHADDTAEMSSHDNAGETDTSVEPSPRGILASSDESSFDSASHDNSHDVAFSATSSSDAAAMESSSPDGSTSLDDVAASTSDGSFDSASHDNSHDMAFSAASDTAMESSSDDGSSHDVAAASISDESTFDSSSHDNSHDMASVSSDTMESSSHDGSSHDLASSTSASDESIFDSASHDNSHDMASSSDDESAASSSSSSSDQELPVVLNAPQGEEDYNSHDTAAVDEAPVVIIAPPDSSSTAVASSSEDGPGFGCQSVSDIVCGQDVLSKLCSLLPADIEENLKGGQWTLFAPTDAAITEVEGVLNSLSGAKVRRIIEFHAHQGSVLFPSDLVCSEKMLMISGDLSRTKCDQNKEGIAEKYQNGNGNTKLQMMPKILLPSLRACNGIIHILDEVMFPVHNSSSEAAAAAKANAAEAESSK